MKFSEVVAQTIAWLQREERVSYRALRREFELDDGFLEDVKAELIEIKRLAVDQDGKMLVWVGAAAVLGPPQSPTPNTQHPSAERRQLTVMFCDLVGSTALSTQLDPEDLREVVRQYQQTCAEVIQRQEGHIAQYLGDGLLVYFGYPTAHEDDARRAVRAGLEIIAALGEQGAGNGERGRSRALQVRIGIHTGLVVIGEMGASGRTEQLALGETPNIAARIQGLAEPNTVIISIATQRLVEGRFECQPFGSHFVKGIDTPIAIYHVQSERQSAAPFAGRTTLTPLVGREQEVGLLVDRWEQVKEGRGQVVLLSGEPGIGKSRLVYTLKERVEHEGSLFFESRCLPYYVNSALYPLIEGIQRTLIITRHESETEQVAKLESALALYGMQDSLPIFTALLSLPTPSQYPPLNLTPQKQKERTLQAAVQWLVAQAERQATVVVWEDVHWTDPSSLEFLTLLIEQIPTTRLLLVLTFRPEFMPPWKPRSHISQLVLNRLGKKQVEAMIEQAATGKDLPPEVIEQIRIKTDGVPLFVEELTKSVVESVGATGRSPLHLAIPATLHDAFMARLDRLGPAKEIAQLGATLGREFSYELLYAVAPVNENELQAALTKLVEAEILYQRGVGEQIRYFFRHALIQDTAYQSLLKSTRQQYHQQIAHVLEERFPDTKAHQPELVAHHYTEAQLIGQAIPYWQQAGQRAMQRSAHQEAISHFTKGLELLKALPDTPECVQLDLTMQIALGLSLITTKGFAAPEVEKAYTRAQELCRQVGETPQLFPVLRGLSAFYGVRGELRTSYKLSEQFLSLAQRVQDPAHLVEAYYMLGVKLFAFGELTSAREHFEQGIAFYDLQKHRTLASLYGHDPRMACLSFVAHTLWLLGYPEQARKRMGEALSWAQELSYPYNLAGALGHAAQLHQYLQEEQAAQERAEATITLATEQRFALVLALGNIWKGWALAEQGQGVEAVPQMRQGLDALWAMGALLWRPYHLTLLAEGYGKRGQPETGLSVLAEALAIVHRTGDRSYEAELYRLQGELTLQQEGSRLQAIGYREKTEEAEECFLKAIDIARQQQAKSLELRATMSLARLWQSQSKTAEAHRMLFEIYNWFTEGFDTKDLQEAKAQLEELESSDD